jgi:hypothetical protein
LIAKKPRKIQKPVNRSVNMEINGNSAKEKPLKGKGRFIGSCRMVSRTIEISATPAVICMVCDIVYQTDDVTKEIED